jgi:hypothetical protein
MEQTLHYCSVAISRMSSSCRYTLLTPSVEDVGKVSKSFSTFWLALAKVGHGIAS